MNAMDETVQASAAPAKQQTVSEASSPEKLKADVIAAIRECYDPEIPVNIVDLGLNGVQSFGYVFP